MGAPRSITDFEMKRLAELAKREGVRVCYQRRPDMPVIEIIPDIPRDDGRKEVDGEGDFTL